MKEQQRIVVKIGSSSLTTSEGGLHRSQIEYFGGELARLRATGRQVLLVTSGAVAAGFRRIGYETRPKQLHEKQAAAAVGQALLMQAYQAAFDKRGITAAQLLLTRSDFSNRKRIGNALMTIDELLKHDVIPIINENDTVSVDELKFGDNDTLSALVGNLVRAQQLIIVTDMDGLYTADPRKDASATRIARVDSIGEDLMAAAGGSGTSVGTGGMRSKLEAARIATRGGIRVFVGRATEPGDVAAAAEGTGKGTYFETSLGALTMKKQWLGFHSIPQGRITVDAGAERALVSGGKSLLPAGVTKVEGDFHPGDVVEVVTELNRVVGRGIAQYASWQVRAAAGLSTEEVMQRIDVPKAEVIHRDEWIAL